MKVLVVNQAEVRRLLPMRECMDVMVEALSALARGEAILPLRPMMWLPERVGVLAMMPSYLGSIHAMGVKVISVFPGNHGTQFDSHQGAVLLFEATHGQLLAMMDATEITAIRTAAVSGVATRLLARSDARSLAILGTGVQARTHLAAMVEARDIGSVRVWSRNGERATQFADREGRRHGIPVSVSGSAREAVLDADIICTTTSSREPVLEGEWIAPGAHVNAVGASIPSARELSTSAVQRSRLYVDRRESTLNEAGDFLMAKQDGAIGDDHIVGEIGELLLGSVAGRRGSEEVTLFKSLGIAIEDLASASYIYRKALEQGVGTSVELGGERDDD
ncbi:MAG: Delta(1)-pyrroline-2-carboxylate reductase [Gemmatimonadetes bacterium]|nr:Delta(1)-pyrroline-2-carboxylate reductase [Gemmatimonadota bacterium]